MERTKINIVFSPPRPPIDSVKSKLDAVGLFNHCVTVKLADGRVIEQNIYPGSTHCQEIFIQSWSMLLNSQWNQVGNRNITGGFYAGIELIFLLL